MIVKVQIPIIFTEPDPKAMVYNEDRSYQGFIPLTVELRELMGSEYKKFFHATIVNGIAKLTEEAPWQTW